MNTLPPPLAFRRRVLANGLTVLTHVSHKTPTVAIQVWYKVGSKDDPAGRSGFAHLFEHLMFKRTRNMPDEKLDRLTEDVGGDNNAYTSPDVTVYHEVVPSNHLDVLLWAEAERLANLQVEAANFFSERDVVKEEYRQSTLAAPYGRLDERLEQLSWGNHPYRRPTGGSLADLDAATLDDVRAFHRQFYRPDNAVLVVAGDFDPAACDVAIDRYFGRLARPSGTIPRVSVPIVPRPQPQRIAATAPNVALPALALSYPAVSVRHPDMPALELLQAVLSQGEAARLNQALVYRQQLASEASAYVDLRTDGGIVVVRLTAASGKSLVALEKATLAELQRLQTAPVSATELQRVKTGLLAGALQRRETVDGIAGALGEAEVLYGDCQRLNSSLPALLAVTAADIQRVARTYLRPERQLTIRYNDGSASTVPTATKAPAPPASPVLPPEENPPAPAAPRRVPAPVFTEHVLPGGCRVVVAPRPGTGLITLALALGRGGATDPMGKAGCAELMGSLLTRGTRHKSATQIAEVAEALGGSLTSDTGWDGTVLELTVPKDNAAPALALLVEVLREPAFAAPERERRRRELIDDITVALEEPSVIAAAGLSRALFGVQRYGERLSGTPATLARITSADIRSAYRQLLRGGATLVIAGDITPTEGDRLAFRALGKVPLAAHPSPVPAQRPQRRRRVLVIDKPDAGQAAVTLGLPGLDRFHALYPVGMLANSLLGGGFSSRLNRAVRIERGLSYGAFSRWDARRQGGLLSLSCQTKNETAAEVATLFVATLRALAESPVSAPELEARRAALLGPLVRGLETGEGLAGALAFRAQLGLPLSELSDLLERLARVTAEEIQAFAKEHWSTENAAIVIVGDSRRFRAVLEKAFGAVEFLPATQSHGVTSGK